MNDRDCVALVLQYCAAPPWVSELVERRGACRYQVCEGGLQCLTQSEVVTVRDFGSVMWEHRALPHRRHRVVTISRYRAYLSRHIYLDNKPSITDYFRSTWSTGWLPLMAYSIPLMELNRGVSVLLKRPQPRCRGRPNRQFVLGSDNRFVFSVSSR